MDLDKMHPDDKKSVEDHYKNSIDDLQDNINTLLEEIDEPIETLLPNSDTIPQFDLSINEHDYDSDLEAIKIDAKETLKCLANLYLDKKNMNNKNINKIIKNDSNQLADLNFAISCARRALMSCMMQLDIGVNDPEMYKSVALFQKEMRDTIKMANELQRKMKDFYKELKKELEELNKGDEVEENETIAKDGDKLNLIGDPRKLNDVFELWKDNPSLLKENHNLKETTTEK